MTTGPQPSVSLQQPAGKAQQIRCPICLLVFRPDLDALYERDSQGNEQVLSLPKGIDQLHREDLIRNALVLCPSKKFREAGYHFLPIDFVRYRSPIVIGLVGTAGTGKSTLLATMIDEIDKNALRDYGIRAKPLAHNKHENFRKGYLDALTASQHTLKRTVGAAEGVDFVDGMLLIKGKDLRQPVVFFDVGGESFIGEDKLTRFIQAFSALIFVVNPDRLTGRAADTDRTFKIVSDRLRPDSSADEQYLDKPAAIVLAKADKLRFDPVVGRWLTRRREAGRIDPVQVQAESRDIYGYLHQRNATWSLLPFDTFRQCTLHAVSATGSNAPEPEQQGNATAPPPAYTRPLRPRRVIEPLVAILAMAGVIDVPGADQVGR